MLQHLRPALVMLALFTLLTGLAYPLRAARHRGGAARARQRKPVKKGDVVVGSRLIGQNFTKDELLPQPAVGDQRDRSKRCDEDNRRAL